MEVKILSLIDGAKAAKGLTVIIDVFRAFSVEAYLAKNNAEKIIPVGGIDEAFEFRKNNPDVILCGEREGKIIDGFDYGNSPSQVENVDFSGKTIIHTTSAGTQGIANAVNADEIIGGSLVTARAIAEYIRQKNPKNVSLVCMGLAGKQDTDEDVLCAEYIKSILDGEPMKDIDERIERIKFTDGAKFFDANQQNVFPERDFYLSTLYDSFDFVLRLKKDSPDGIACMERVDINYFRSK